MSNKWMKHKIVQQQQYTATLEANWFFGKVNFIGAVNNVNQFQSASKSSIFLNGWFLRISDFTVPCDSYWVSVMWEALFKPWSLSRNETPPLHHSWSALFAAASIRLRRERVKSASAHCTRTAYNNRKTLPFAIYSNSLVDLVQIYSVQTELANFKLKFYILYGTATPLTALVSAPSDCRSSLLLLFIWLMCEYLTSMQTSWQLKIAKGLGRANTQCDKFPMRPYFQSSMSGVPRQYVLPPDRSRTDSPP